jgi:HK97 family phage portal protein
MGNFSEWVNNSPNCLLQDDFYPLPLGGFTNQFNVLPDDFSRVHSYLSLNLSSKLFEAVTLCSPLAAIIANLSDAYANGKQEVLNRSTQNYVRGTYKEWERLMDKPNPLQTRSQFRKQLYSFTKINGWCYVYPEYSVGFPDRPSALWILPPYLVEVEATELVPTFPLKDPKKFRKLYFSLNGIRQQLDETKLIMFTDDATEIDYQTLLPISRLVSLQKPISNIIAGLDARNNLIVRRGALGFISSDGQDAMGSKLPMQPQQRKEIANEFHKSYGLTGQRSMVAVVSAAVKWQQTAISTRDLMLFEEHESSTIDIADRFGYPAYLLGVKDGNFTNTLEAEKSLYQNTIIPDSVAIDESLNEGLKTMENNIEIKNDYSHIESLQQSEQERSQARKSMNEACKIEWDNGLITLNEWRERLGDDTIAGEQYNMRKPEYDEFLKANLQTQTQPNESNTENTQTSQL